MARRKIRSIHHAAPGVAFVEGPGSNWTVLVGASGDVSLIDAGYPADVELVVESIRLAGGEPERLSSIYVTHGHSDHIGSINELRRRYHPRVFAAAAEIPNVSRQVTIQVGLRDVLRNILLLGVFCWALEAIAAGGLRAVGVSGVEAVSEGPIQIGDIEAEVRVTSGHTPGHVSYYLTREQILIAGDVVVSAHPTSRTSGPQMLHDMFHADPAQLDQGNLALQALPAHTVFPGHGPRFAAARLKMHYGCQNK